MVKDKKSRVDFGMAEALAFGTLALHRGVRPPGAAAGGHDSHDWQPSTLDSQLQQEELIGADPISQHHPCKGGKPLWGCSLPGRF